MNVKQNINVLLSEVNLVRLNKPEEIFHKQMKTLTKQVKNSGIKNVDSLNLDDNVVKKLKCNDVLNLIWPPKKWEKDGKLYYQTISNQPAVLWDVKALIQNLNMHLEQFKARELGICPNRREIYRQCFNETIRQETLNCTERGHLLIQIRDEMKMTLDAYQKLNESVIGNRIRKTLLLEQKKLNLKKRIILLKSENEKIEADLAKINAKTEERECEMVKVRDQENKHQFKELIHLKEANQVLKAQIISIIMPTKII